ncbi:MAG TPA: hypothetical protein DCL42_05745 [Deltaproteobacteria bacterium]|nr:hypothetical protein [Deltaproteobacteria bacterium]
MNFVLTKNITKNRISSAVILGGGYSTTLGPLTRHSRIFMLPILNRPFIEYTIESLNAHGIKNIIISSSKEHNIDDGEKWLKDIRRKFSAALEIQHVMDNRPRGTAGALSDLKDFIGGDCFLVLNGNIFLRDFDLNDILASHITSKSVVTVGVKKQKRLSMEGISIGEDNAVRDFYAIHSSRDRRSSLKPAGIYVFDPAALRFIKDNIYFDIKEQLIPALNKANLSVHAYEVNGHCRAINSVDDYYDIQREELFNGYSSRENMSEIAEGVWAGSNLSISPDAYILGPTIIGNNCRIGANAQIIGPTVIGDNCVIGKMAKLRESILWNDVKVGEDSNIRYCVAGHGLILAGDLLSNKVLIDRLKPEDINLIPRKYKIDSVAEQGALHIGSARHLIFSGLKRFMDIMVSTAMFILLSPLLLITALAIKMDSDGSVIFKQQRCGRGGKDFEMLKFRTMVNNAEGMQHILSAKKDVDGPMFKLQNDPRVTRVGSVLRKTSLDELPQLMNVLKGEMSLVGPRPLAMNEMKFSPSWRGIRLKVKPGITGLWQVQGRSEASFHDWIRYDVYYVKNQSLWLDIKILLRTIAVVFRKIGAY